MNAIEKIEAQQKGKENTDVWMVGEQLKEIIGREPETEDLISKDLEVKEMSLSAAAGKIKAYADELHKKIRGACVCVPPDAAEGILRKFYGLPERKTEQPAAEEPKKSDFIDLADFL